MQDTSATGADRKGIVEYLASLVWSEHLISAALGLGCLLTAQSSMRISSIMGIYPVEGSLLLRHLLAAVAVLLALFVVMRAKERPKPTVRTKAALMVLSVLSAATLLLKYSEPLFNVSFGAAAAIGRVVEEALLALMLVIWIQHLIPLGFRRNALIITAAMLFQALLQLLLSALQLPQCILGICALPVMSGLLFLFFFDRHAEAVFADAPPTAVSKSGILSTVAFLMVVAAGMLIAGHVLYLSLEEQSLYAYTGIPQLFIFIGNAVGALSLIIIAVKVRQSSFVSVLPLLLFALSAVCLYVTTFDDRFTMFFYLFVSSIMLQFCNFLVFTAAFSLAGLSPLKRAAFPLAYGVSLLARSLSSFLMLVDSSGMSMVFNTVVLVSLVVLFAAAMVFYTRTNRLNLTMVPLDGAVGRETGLEGATEEGRPGGADSASPTGAGPRPASGDEASADPEEQPSGDVMLTFNEAVAFMAAEAGLTPQEKTVLTLLARGYNASSISSEMVVSINTTKSHMRRIYQKLGVHSQQEIIVRIHSLCGQEFQQHWVGTAGEPV